LKYKSYIGITPEEVSGQRIFLKRPDNDAKIVRRELNLFTFLRRTEYDWAEILGSAVGRILGRGQALSSMTMIIR
jgi:hypothetical protein